MAIQIINNFWYFFALTFACTFLSAFLAWCILQHCTPTCFVSWNLNEFFLVDKTSRRSQQMLRAICSSKMKTLQNLFSRRSHLSAQSMSELAANINAVWPNPAEGQLPQLSDFARQQLELCRQLVKPSAKPEAVNLNNFMALSESFPAAVCTCLVWTGLG